MRYLFIQFVRKPGGQIDELVTVSKKVKPSDIQTMNIILDFKDKLIVKAVIERTSTTLDWDKTVEYYRKIYPTLISQLEADAQLPV